ncbi:ArsR family transcriptional regulator [Halomicroarcula limicola]|uniref:ArsR family transcriptional regulator n=2 Tax=Haloarcula limicola TaxID=1429915 RepID=A0A8J7Y9K7_9EURY|nr:ArsR family transcriptional regulator [Halomicroarcula limicola]
MTPEDRGLTTPMVDDVFEALADWRRRAVCLHFQTAAETQATVGDLAGVVARQGRDSGLPEADTAVDAVESALIETQLPVLHRLAVLDFDERSGTVRYWGCPTLEKWADHAAAVSRRSGF